MTVPPYAAAAVVLSITAWVSDLSQIRGPFVAGWSIVTAIGYVYVVQVLFPDSRFTVRQASPYGCAQPARSLLCGILYRLRDILYHWSRHCVVYAFSFFGIVLTGLTLNGSRPQLGFGVEACHRHPTLYCDWAMR
jgi:hypothetical protein